MEEPDSSSSEDNETRDLQHSATSKVESDESYSDSDSDEHKEPKSMFHILKAAHVPGKYKQSLDPEADKHSDITDVRCLEVPKEQAVIEEEANNQSCVSTNDVDIDIQGNKQGDDGVQRFPLKADSDFAETGIFGKSMLVISSTMVDGDQSMKEDGIGLSKRPPPPVPPKPSLRTYDQIKPDKEDRVSLDTRPKPAPRKSKRSSEAYSDEQILLTDVLPTEKISPVSPAPSPRMKRKSDEAELPTGTEMQLAESEMIEYQDVFDEKHESKSDEQMTDLQESSTTLGKEKEISSDNTVDTVDIGSAKDLVLGDLSENIISKQKSITVEDKEEHNFTEETMIIKETTDIQQSGILSSFEILGSQETTNIPSEENDSDSEEKSRFVNNLQETDSGKGDNGSEQTLSESEPDGEFGTPDSRSEDEGETDEFYDSISFQYIKKEDTDNTEMGAVEKDTEELFSQDESQIEKVDYMKEQRKAFDESVVIIGKGTVKETGYESLSSTVSSGDLTAATFQTDMSNAEKGKEETKSIHAKIRMFEAIGKGKSTKGNESDFEKTRKSYASGSSFEILSDDSDRSELRSDDFLTRTEETIGDEGTETVHVNKDSGVILPSGPVSDTEKEIMQSPETNADIYSQSGKPMDVNNVTVNEHSLHVVGKYETLNQDLESRKRDNIQNSEEGSLQDEVPPSIAPKSEKVMESLKLLVKKDAQDIPPRSLPLKTEDKEELDVTENELPLHVVAKYEKLDLDFESRQQDDTQNSDEDSLQDEVPPPIAPKSEKVLESLKSLVRQDAPDIPPKSLPLKISDREALDEEVKRDLNFQSFNREGFVECSDSEQTSLSQGKQLAAQSASAEDISQQHWYGHQYQQQQQMPPYPNMQYEHQQQQYQQQPPPMLNQPYIYPDQYGNMQHMYPYAFYNPSMNQGMPINPDMQYYQQQYFSHQNFGNLYGHSYERDPSNVSHIPINTDENVYEEVQQSPENEKRSLGAQHSSQSYWSPSGQTIEADPERGLHTEKQTKEVDTMFQKPTGTVNRRSVVNAENQQSYSQHSEDSMLPKTEKANLSKTKTTTAVKEATGRDTASAVRRSASDTTYDKRKYGSKKKKEKLGRNQKSFPEKLEEVVKKEDYYILFIGINPRTNLESLAYFTEAATDGEAVQEKVIFNYSRTSALVTVSLTHKPDISRIKAKVQKNGIDGKKPDIYLVPQPGSIAVSSEDNISYTEGLGLYFENPRSGGAGMTGDLFESEDGCCYIICYGNPDVVKRVCEKKHHIWEEKSLRVSPYYECEAGAIWDCDLHAVKIPEPVVIKLQPDYLTFIKRKCCEDLLSGLENKYCHTSFTEEGLKVECTLNPKTSNVKNLAKGWESTVRSIVDSYIGERIIERNLRSSRDVWSELVQFFNEENIQNMTEIVSTLDDAASEITLIGFTGPVNNEIDKLKAKKEEIQRYLSRVSKTIDIKPMRLRLMKSIRVFEKLKQNLTDIELYFGDGEVTVEGQPDDVTQVRLRMHEIPIKESTWKHEFSDECVDFVGRILKDKLNEVMKKTGVIAEWEINTEEVKFCFLDGERSQDDESDYEQIDEDAYYSIANVDDDARSKFIQIFKANIFEKQLSFQPEIGSVFDSEEWVSQSMSITESYEQVAQVELNRKTSNITVYGLTENARSVYAMVREFLEENAVYEEQMGCGTICIKFMKRHKTDLVCQIESKYDKMKLHLKDDRVIIRGNRKQIAETKKELNKMFASIFCKDHTIDKVAVKGVFRDEREHGAIERIENDTKCIIQLPGENETVFTHTQSVYEKPYFPESDDGYLKPVGATAAPVDRGETAKRPFKAPNGISITLVKGEIGQQDGDVIVVTTSPNLNLSSGKACSSVLKAGGKALQDECKANYPKEIKHGEIAVIHGGGSLECNRVYLTSLPNWTSDESSKQILLAVMKKCLDMASKHKKHSILFCAMGTGQLKYPTEIVAMLMYQSVIDFDHDNKKTTLKDIKFVLYQKDFTTIKVFEEEERLRIEGDGTRPIFELQKGAIKIELAVENIAEQKVDGILCSTSPKMDLSRNGACQALLRAGGSILQDECKSKFSNHLESGQVAEISGGNMHCKSVFLTVIEGYNQHAIDNLEKVLTTCLGLAHAKNYKSLALPALGTGFLKYPKDQVCKCMFDAVIRWGVENPGTSIKTVRFIMYAKDREVIQTFKSYIKTAQGRAPRKGRKTDIRGIKQTPGRQTTSLYNANQEGFQIRGVQLTVSTGDILEQKTDVIVSSVSPAFEFVGGVAHTLLKKCSGLADEIKDKKLKFNKKGYVMTSSHSLPSKCIIHVGYVESTSAWKQQMVKCLEKANKKRFKTIAFPVLGTGQGMKSFSPEAISECLFDAISDFAASPRRCIKEVRLIVYKGQQFMYKPVMDVLHKKIQVAASGKVDSTSLKEKAKGFAKGAFNYVIGRTQGEMTKDDWQKLKEQTSSMVLKIHSDCQANIDKCIKELDAQLEQAYSKKKIEDYKDIIKSLTSEEKDELEIDALANIRTDQHAGIITIEGPLRTVADVHSDLQTKLLRIDRRRNDFKRAEEYYKVVRWHFEEITDLAIEHVEYDKMLNYKIEQAYKDNKNNLEFTDSEGVSYVIDLVKLVEYPKGEENETVRVLRKDILKLAASALPQEWAPMKETENLRRINIPNTDQKYKDIEQRFLNEVRNGQYSGRIMFDKNKVQITKIERIQNKTLYQQYQAKKKLITEQKPSLPPKMPVEQELWHGTTHDAVDSIEMHGFNRSYCGKNGIWFGAGVYFARDASYSARGWLTGANPGTTGVKGYIFLVKVLTGEYCKGNDKMRYLPPVDPNKPTVLYDCAVDNVANPMEFVIFHDTQAYPEFIITFSA